MRPVYPVRVAGGVGDCVGFRKRAIDDTHKIAVLKYQGDAVSPVSIAV